MGADISLRSVLTDEVHKAILERVAIENHRSIKTSADVLQVAEAIYTALAETGAYFRDPYNRFGLLPMLGMSWGGAMSALCSRKTGYFQLRQLAISWPRSKAARSRQRILKPPSSDRRQIP
jgi:hypothetical protein